MGEQETNSLAASNDADRFMHAGPTRMPPSPRKSLILAAALTLTVFPLEPAFANPGRADAIATANYWRAIIRASDDCRNLDRWAFRLRPQTDRYLNTLRALPRLGVARAAVDSANLIVRLDETVGAIKRGEVASAAADYGSQAASGDQSPGGIAGWSVGSGIVAGLSIRGAYERLLVSANRQIEMRRLAMERALGISLQPIILQNAGCMSANLLG